MYVIYVTILCRLASLLLGQLCEYLSLQKYLQNIDKFDQINAQITRFALLPKPVTTKSKLCGWASTNIAHMPQGLYSLSGRPFFRKISQSLDSRETWI